MWHNLTEDWTKARFAVPYPSLPNSETGSMYGISGPREQRADIRVARQDARIMYGQGGLAAEGPWSLSTFR